jgi:hypothetical protein
VGPLHCCPPLMTTRIPGSSRPLYSARLPALRQINFGLSPVLYQGNVVARVNFSERTPSDHQCHLKNHHLLVLQFDIKTIFLKSLQWGKCYPKVFGKHFCKLYLSVPSPRVLAPLESLSKALLLTNMPPLQR